MYYLTVRGPCVEQWMSRCRLPVGERRVYRWNNIWGYLQSDGFTAWKRSFVSECSNGDSYYNLEKQEYITCIAPPLLCDDIWEEEFVEHTRGTCNGLLSITGTMKDIQMWAKTAHIPIPESLWMGVPEITNTGIQTVTEPAQPLSQSSVRHFHSRPHEAHPGAVQQRFSRHPPTAGVSHKRPHGAQPYRQRVATGAKGE